MKLGYPAFVVLLTVSFFASASLCLGQSTQSPAANPAQPQNPEAQPPSAPSATQNPSAQAPQDPKKTDDPKTADSKTAAPTQDDAKKKEMDRMFYVMPNYLTVDGAAQTPPVSWKEKFSMAAKGSFDPYEFVTVSIVAGIRQAENSSPGFGQGAEGYFKRYGASFADQVDGNIMVGGVFPTILKTDPRYFRLGRGSKPHRMGYAMSRIFVTRTDSGHSTFNISESAGNATAIAISNFYYPASGRSATSSLYGWGLQMGIDAFGNELKEFWPDIHHYFQQRHARHLEKETEKQDSN